jgi:pheromone shutdown protein TraB
MININDFNEVVANRLLKFADDTKLCGVVVTAQDIEGLKKDLDNLCSWSKDSLMLFNISKCKIMHFGYNNRGINFEMNG